jgi:hypothetical protein
MNPRLSHREIEELLGAFALHAVEADEAAVIDRHLGECPRCRAEVAAHRETAALLVEDRLEPPAGLWDRLVAGLEEAPPPIDLAQFSRTRAAHRRAVPRWLAVAAAVAVVVGVGSFGFQQQRQVDKVEAALSGQEVAVEALAAFNDPSARLATLRSTDGAEEIRAVLLRDGTGYVLADRLPDLTGEQTYQLWAMIDGHPVSARNSSLPGEQRDHRTCHLRGASRRRRAAFTPDSPHRPARMTTTSSTQPIHRFKVAAGLLVLAALGHAFAIPHHADPGHGGPAQGAVFAAVAAAQLLGAAAIARRPGDTGRRTVAVAGSALLIIVWAISRTAGLPYGPHPGEAEVIGTLDAVTVAAQLGVIGLLLHTGRRLRLPMTIAGSFAVIVIGLATLNVANVATPAQATTHHEHPDASRDHMPANERAAEPEPANAHADSEREGEPGHSHPDATEHAHP